MRRGAQGAARGKLMQAARRACLPGRGYRGKAMGGQGKGLCVFGLREGGVAGKTVAFAQAAWVAEFEDVLYPMNEQIPNTAQKASRQGGQSLRQPSADTSLYTREAFGRHPRQNRARSYFFDKVTRGVQSVESPTRLPCAKGIGVCRRPFPFAAASGGFQAKGNAEGWRKQADGDRNL